MKPKRPNKLDKITEGRSEQFKAFFDWSLDFLYEHKKTIKAVNSRNVNMNYSQKCSGWCDGSEIVVALKNPLFEQVYVHEFCHMMQAVEESILWKEEDDFWDMLNVKSLAVPDYFKVMEVIALERDCEQRSIALSKKWELFDNEKYAKQANLYLHYYQYLFFTNKWINSTSIYHPMLLDYMPSKIQSLGSFYKIDMDLMNLYHNCLHKNGRFYKKGFGT